MAFKCAHAARILGISKRTLPFRRYGQRPMAPIDERYDVVEPEEAYRLKMDAERKRQRTRDYMVEGERKPSFSVRSSKYMWPFTVDVFISAKYVHANVMNRSQHKVVATVSTNSRELKALLPCRCDDAACKVVGELLAERAKEADCYAVSYQARSNERLEGKLATVLKSLVDCGISVFHGHKGILLTKE